MISVRDTNIIIRIDRYCDQIFEAMSWYENSIDVLKTNHLYKDGIAMKFQQISELSQHLTNEFTREHGSLPWQSIKGLRVVFAHRYETLNYDTMWETMTVKIPELKLFCTDILALAKKQTLNLSDNGPGHGGPRMG
ncbi:MAG: DUF86 domain-containing protein [Deltaproteobacteria bacterium]|jgi:uncharacterized protein with HEPN domain|nr:DUF86 domain-containing protein [Deltaproteobacteria bacterium]